MHYVLALRCHSLRRVAKLAFYDPLTGAANRVLLLDRLTQLIDAHRRDGKPFTVIAFDLDDFKLINDQLGHQVGDAFLRSMSARCKSELRSTDTFACLVGDEFIALIPDVATRDRALSRPPRDSERTWPKHAHR